MFEAGVPGADEALCAEYLLSQKRIAMEQARSAALLAQIEDRGAHYGPSWERGKLFLWVRSRTHCSRYEAQKQVRRARALARLPLVAESLATGATTAEHVDAVAPITTMLEPEQLAEVEPSLVAAVEQGDVRDLHSLVRHTRERKDPEGAARAAARADSRDQVFLSPYGTDGRYAINGTLSATDGAALEAALEPLMKPRGEDSTLIPEQQPAHRRARAVGELARRDLAHGDLPANGGLRPQTTVIVPLSTLRSEDGSPGAKFVGGPTIDGATARAYACDSAMTRVIVDDTQPMRGPAGRPVTGPDAAWKARMTGLLPWPLAAPSVILDLGRTRRTASEYQRKALAVRDRGCVRPGCDRPPSWCDVHHLNEWLADHGNTDLDDLVLLCHEHHLELHRYNLCLERDPDGSYCLIDRDDHVIAYGRARPPDTGEPLRNRDLLQSIPVS